MQDNGIALYRRFLAGDKGALEELIALYQRGLLRFIMAYVRDLALAEDVLTDVFLTLYYKRSFKERDDASLKTYVYKIARNKALNVLKQQARRKEVSLETLMEKGDGALNQTSQDAAFLYDEGYSPQEVLEKGDRAKALREALQRLKPEYREALTLRYLEDMSPETIAKITKRKPKQVYNLLSRGKAALKEELSSGGVTYEDF